MARVLITGVKLRPSGKGYSFSSVSRRKTRIPLAGSITGLPPNKVTRLFQAENKLETVMMMEIAKDVPLAK